MSATTVSIRLVPGTVGPKYSDTEELQCAEVVITEQGTEGFLPIVDFVLRGDDGKRYLVVFTGRIVNAIASAVKGANVRNHGVSEP